MGHLRVNKKVEKIFPFLGELIREFYEKCFHFLGFVNITGYKKKTIFLGTYGDSGTLVRKMLKNFNIFVSPLNKNPLGRRGTAKQWNKLARRKVMPLIRKRRIWWEPVPEATSYVVYVANDSTIFDPGKFLWEATPGIVSKHVSGKTELIIPDEWPEFPMRPGTYHIGITAQDEVGNQSDPFLSAGQFKFFSPPAPPNGGIESP